MMNPHSFSATPTPAEGITPREFAIAVMARKEIPHKKILESQWAVPGGIRFPFFFCQKTISVLRKVKGSFCLRIISTEMITLERLGKNRGNRRSCRRHAENAHQKGNLPQY